MLSREEVEREDPSGIHLDYEEWPQLCETALNQHVETPSAGDVDQIIYAGMGGSAASGDLLRDWLTPTLPHPFTVLKDYDLPRSADANTFVITVSCSGDTEETISVARQAFERGCRFAAVSSGGRLEMFCRENRLSFTKVRKLRAPRSSMPSLFYAAANILREIGVLGDASKQLLTSVAEVRKVYSEIRSDVAFDENPAKKLASKITYKLPVVYASADNAAASARFRASLNENAKILAHVALIPELCHNEVEGWTENTPDAVQPIYMRNGDEPAEVSARFEAVREMIERAGFTVQEIWESGGDRLSRILRSVYLLDYTSIYVAILRNVDPIVTPNIDAMKRRLRGG
jgi:glucose/mannose-6-phosphate isomerase